MGVKTTHHRLAAAISANCGAANTLALAATPALAQDTGQGPRAGIIQLAQSIQAETRRFNIPAGDLQAALLTFSEQVDLQLLYPAELTEGLTTQGVQGEYTPQEALQRLVAGPVSGLLTACQSATLARHGASFGTLLCVTLLSQGALHELQSANHGYYYQPAAVE